MLIKDRIFNIVCAWEHSLTLSVFAPCRGDGHWGPAAGERTGHHCGAAGGWDPVVGPDRWQTRDSCQHRVRLPAVGGGWPGDKHELQKQGETAALSCAGRHLLRASPPSTEVTEPPHYLYFFYLKVNLSHFHLREMRCHVWACVSEIIKGPRAQEWAFHNLSMLKHSCH